MLKLPNPLIGGKEGDIITKFVSDRIIEIMDSIIIEEITSYRRVVPANIDYKDLIDIDELLLDRDFAEEVSMWFLPDNYPIEKANYEFFSLYRLLKAKGEYVPELPQEYILCSLLQQKIDEGMDLLECNEEFDSDEFFIKKISEPDRTKILDILEKVAKEMQEDDLDDITAEYLINKYEDIREYEETCFWDWDFDLLDNIDEETLINSELAEYMGIGKRRDVKTYEFPTEDGESTISVTVNIAPWDEE